MNHAAIATRPDCTHCLADLQQRAEQDRQDYRAKIDAAYTDLFAVLDRAEQQAADALAGAGCGERVPS